MGLVEKYKPLLDSMLLTGGAEAQRELLQRLEKTLAFVEAQSVITLSKYVVNRTMLLDSIRPAVVDLQRCALSRNATIQLIKDLVLLSALDGWTSVQEELEPWST